MADKKSLIDHWMDMEEDQPVGTAGMFNTAPDPKEVDQVSQAASDWWEWRNAKGWDLNPRDVAEGLAGQPLGAIAGIMAGKGAKMADFLSMREALSKLDAGMPRSQVWQENGWGKGADGKPRFEIDDSGAKIKDGIDENSVNFMKDVPLGQILDHPELYKNYPELEHLPVTGTAFNPFASGWYNKDLDKMAIKPSLLKQYAEGEKRPWDNTDGKEGLRTLLHEAQHYVQTKEGFAEGTNSQANLSKDISKETRNARDQYTQIEADPEFAKGLEQMGDVFNIQPLQKWDFENLYTDQPIYVRDYDTGASRQLHPDEVDAMRTFVENEPILMDAMDKLMQVRQGKDVQKTGERIYKESLGEREAKDVERRMNMPPEERANTLPESFNRPENALAVPHFAEGGTVMDTMKQGFMQPPGEAGALPIEKADTVPAKLSEGEFVIPAEEVRWHGLKTFMQMKLEAEEGLRTMESIGQIREPGQPEAVQTEIAPPDQYATGGLINKRMGLNPDYNLLNPDTKVLQDQEKNSFFIPPQWAGGAGDPADGSVGGVNENMTLMDAVANIGMFATNPVGFAVSAMLAQRDNPNMTTVPSITTTIGKALGLIDKDPTDYGFMPAFDREKDNVTLDTDPAFSQPPEKSISDTFKDETDNAVKDAAANFGGIKGDPTANVSNDPVNGMIEGSLSNPTSPAIDANATIDGPSSPSSPSDPTGPTGPSSPSDPTGPSDPSSDPSSDSDGGSDGDGYAKGGLIKRPKRDTKKK